MQVVYQDKDKRSSNRGTDSVDLIIYTRRISRYIEEKYVGRPKERTIGI